LPIWRRYEQEQCTPDELKAREDRLVEMIVRQHRYDLRHAMNARAYVKEWLSNNERVFDHYRRSFLMIDSFPENEDRFSLTYRSCSEAAA
jgi:hypothetical protein